MAESMKLWTVSEWEDDEDFDKAFTVRGCAVIPRLRSDSSPLSLIPNCWSVLDKAIWNELHL